MKEHNKELKKLFKLILKADVEIKDNLDENEEIIFKNFIDNLDLANTMENKLMEEGGVDCHRLTDPLWHVIENTFRLLYGVEATDIVLWYIYDRFNPDGSIVPLEGPNDKVFILKDSNGLWSYIKFKTSK